MPSPAESKTAIRSSCSTIAARFQITARVTARIMPGVVGMPHAHRREMVNGVDVGANANTLTSHHWSPISKNCPSTGSTLVQVKKA
ncbi:MAG: molybdopterin dinucleotide binding domain-containing protein [Eggerthella lenta]